MNIDILLVEDDEEISQMLSALLKNEGFKVDLALDGLTGEQKALNKKHDVIILDIMLPEKDGLSVLKDLRSKIKTPILMLTAKGDDLDRILGIELGADDYLPKPFNPRELVARVKALIRRVKLDTETEEEQKEIAINNLLINPKTRQVTVDDSMIELTAAEFNVLHTLASKPNEIISREQLTEKALGRKLSLYDRAIDMHLSNLRKKIQPESILTVRGAGYLFKELES